MCDSLGAETENTGAKTIRDYRNLTRRDFVREEALDALAVPVWDGMAAAYGRLCLSTKDGRVLFLGPR